MKISKVHHYIPEFYLKQFTNEQGLFHIYNVKKQSFKKHGQLFAPSSHFYELNANTVTYGVESSDFLEQSLATIDNSAGDIYKKISDKAGSGEYLLSSEEWTFLQYFISIMYWRNPSTNVLVEQKIKNASCLKDLGLILRSKDKDAPVGGEEELALFNKAKSDTDFLKFYKAMIPNLTYVDRLRVRDNDFAHIFTFPIGLPKLVSDNPIIYRNPGQVSIHLDDMIFPITPIQVLIRNKYSGLIVHSCVRILIDMLLVLQANKYVACTDLKYPISLVEEYDKRFKSVGELRETIFRFIFQKTNGKSNL